MPLRGGLELTRRNFQAFIRCTHTQLAWRTFCWDEPAVTGSRPGTGGQAAEGDRLPALVAAMRAARPDGRHPAGDVRADAPWTRVLVSVLRQGAP